MNWITGMQKAIDYIEEHITDELEYTKIAEAAYVSSFNFHIGVR